MRISAIRYEDLYPKSFVAFRKKYLPLLKSADRHRLYVQFTNFMDNTLVKKAYETPNHHDPVAIYAYPLEYVLKYPADVWYGNKAKFLRVLKERKSSNTLHLQSMTESEASSIIYKMGLPYDSMDKAKLLWPDRISKGQGSIGRAFFQAVQMDMSGIEKIPRDKSARKALAEKARIRTGKEQTALFRKAGFDAIEDTAKNAKQAVVNDREPEQIAFLTGKAFDVVEVVPLRIKSGGLSKTDVGTAQDTSSLASKLAAMIAGKIGDRLVDKDDKNRTFWTKAGREIAINFERPASYYEGKKLGEKKHKEAKFSTPHYIKVTLKSERGTAYSSSHGETFVEVADYIADIFNTSPVVPDFKPISKASRKAEADAAKAAYYKAEKEKKLQKLKQEAPEDIEKIKAVAERLSVPFTQAEYWNSSDKAREGLATLIAVIGRHLADEKYRVEREHGWDFYGFYDKAATIGKVEQSVNRLSELYNIDQAAATELLNIYRAALDWMLENKTWSFQAPAGFFYFVLRDLEAHQAKSLNAKVAEALKLVAAILSGSTLTLYRGESGKPGNFAWGKGRYYTDNPDVAQMYGTVSEHQVHVGQLWDGSAPFSNEMLQSLTAFLMDKESGPEMAKEIRWLASKDMTSYQNLVVYAIAGVLKDKARADGSYSGGGPRSEYLARGHALLHAFLKNQGYDGIRYPATEINEDFKGNAYVLFV